jgi:hypothetical protein
MVLLPYEHIGKNYQIDEIFSNWPLSSFYHPGVDQVFAPALEHGRDEKGRQKKVCIYGWHQ